MLFNTLEFWAFFIVVVSLFYASPYPIGKVILLIASYVFYMWWDPRFAALIAGSTIVNYYLGKLIYGSEQKKQRILLWTSIILNLSMLAFFKYLNFFIDSLEHLIGVANVGFSLSIILPVGISFYTFKNLSYTVDIYKKRITPINSIRDYALFLAFFPELVAGPIVRADVFIPQLLHWKPPTAAKALYAVNIIILGLVKKVVLADNFAAISDRYFSDVYAYTGWYSAWSGAFAFTMQIYFDFSGYTDIARGCALLLGIEFPINFLRPYFSWSFTEFWRRWHISLSSWLRDYLYVPLGGNRKGSLATYRNLMVTMLLGGLWHGASWTFVVWGGMHGALLALERLSRDLTSQLPTGLQRVTKFLGYGWALLVFPLVVITWVPFRAATFSEALYTVSQMFTSESGPRVELITGSAPYFVLASIVIAALEERFSLLSRLWQSSTPFRIGWLIVLLTGLELFGFTDRQIPFVYFQF